MRILDRYTLKNAALGYFFVLVIFIGLFFLVDTFSNLSDILKSKTPLLILARYYLGMIPWIFKWVSPFAILISMLYTLGELNRSNEIVGMRSAGVSIIALSMPLILFSLIISFLGFYLQEEVLINSQKKVEEIKRRFIKKNLEESSLERNFKFASGNLIFFALEFSPKEKTLTDVAIFQEDEHGNFIKEMICKDITYQDQKWVANLVKENLFDKNGLRIDSQTLAKKEIALAENPQELLLKKSILLEFRPLKDLKREIRQLKKIGSQEKLKEMIIQYNQKLADPFSHFFLIIGILPFALEIKKRKVGLTSLGVGFIFGFIYYFIASFSIALGKSGIILAFLSPWMAPLFFLTIGITGLALIR
ncbi:MAG: LptF/LptG family permease [Candidatus Omnitrophica bacterium]|nr:LptF/LptG family permease [Candidatus Omnitrophota bacterium]